MAVTPSILADGILKAHQDDLFVAANTYYVSDLIFTNAGASARTVNVATYTTANQGNRYIVPKDLSLVAGGTMYLSLRGSLVVNDKVVGWADNNTDVTYIIWGGENT